MKIHVVMFKINHFLFLKGSYEVNWYEERRRNTRPKKKKTKTLNPFTFANWRSDLFPPIIQIPILELYATFANGQISSRATCDST